MFVAVLVGKSGQGKHRMGGVGLWGPLDSSCWFSGLDLNLPLGFGRGKLSEKSTPGAPLLDQTGAFSFRLSLIPEKEKTHDNVTGMGM